ncbi:MAG TPA: hypothetical protein VN660_07760 [Steroidobacteraceae bacterium]|nr:hypothetical protein [Steroidobacteraceae bacterium]
MKKLFISTAALIAALNLSGCMLMMAGSGYHGDQGDLVSNDGDIRYVGWCDVHPHNAHCLSSSDAKTDAIAPAPARSAAVTKNHPTPYRLRAAAGSGESPLDLADIN